jgi:uncharacterized membrane protein required for colicin V production
MSVLDLIILLYVIPFAILGYRDGFFKKSMGVLALLLGLIAATKLMAKAGKWVSKGFHAPPELSNIIAFFLVLALVVIAAKLLYRWIKGRTDQDIPKMFSRIAGAAIGAFEGLVATSLVLILLYVVDQPSLKLRQNSALYRPFIQLAPAVFDYSTMWVPESKAFLDELKDHFVHYNISK